MEPARKRTLVAILWPVKRGCAAAASLPLVKRRYAAAVLLGAAACCAAPASAAPPRLSLSKTAAAPGERVVATAHGLAAGRRLRLVVGGRTLKRLAVTPGGAIRLSFRVPARRPARYRLTVLSGGHVLRGRLRIVAPAPPAPQHAAPPSAPATSSSASAPAPDPPPPDPPTLVAAGDIACEPGWAEIPTQCRQARTADLVQSLAPDAVAVLGDLQYETGVFEKFLGSYDLSWGAFKGITRPAVGNHEYQEDPERDAAPGYFQYFGAAAGDPAKGYYRWELGGWNVFVLNTGDISWARDNLALADCWPVSCKVGSPQETWLRAELAALPNDSCVLAYWHHPRVSSGSHGGHRSHPETAPLVDALYDHGAELILTGHAHNYERFEPIDATGSGNPQGVAHFVVGTGGRSLRSDTGPPLTTTLRTDLFGVLELTLEPTAWSSRFVAEDGQTVDPAGADCHGRPTP
ncbi:MAG TPA: metallophosphoesterase [Thermoleophilaceae bacterium]|nr:metallophosphoesterase [Thermoleophilaceae bacterium]